MVVTVLVVLLLMLVLYDALLANERRVEATSYRSGVTRDATLPAAPAFGFFIMKQ